MIQAITHTSIELPKENEVIDVCKAIDDMMEDSRNEGRLEGERIGKIAGEEPVKKFL